MFGSIYDWLWWICVVLYVPACIGLIAIVLLQKGKGVGFAGAFGLGGGGADTVFGPRMSKSLPVKLTYVMAGMFVVLALGMSILAGRITKGEAPELVEETVDMSAYEERGAQTVPEEAGGGTATVVPAEGGEMGAAPEETTPEEPAAIIVDESTTEDETAGDGGEASAPAEQ
jgi:preprotein translocase subunit SecG